MHYGDDGEYYDFPSKPAAPPPCPLCSPETAPKVFACITSSCAHGHFPADECFRCHPEKCPCRNPEKLMKPAENPYLDPTPAGVVLKGWQKGVEAVQLDDTPVPYQGVKYERSDVAYTRVNLFKYLGDRNLVLPPQLQFLVKNLPAGAFIAGGAVAALATGNLRGRPADIDIFFSCEEALALARRLMRGHGREVEGPQVPAGVIQVEPAGEATVQLISFGSFFPSAEEVVDGFDFTCTQFAVDVFSRELVFNPNGLLDYARGLLLNHRFEGDEAAAKRIKKYLAKGFRPVGYTETRARQLGLWNDQAALDHRIMGRAL